MIKTLFLLLAQVLFIAAQPLPQLLKDLEEQNPDVLAARLEQRKAAEQADGAAGLLWPSLSFNAGYNHVSDLARIDFPALPGVSPRTVSLGQRDNYAFSLNARYLLFNGFGTRALIDAAKTRSAISGVELKARRKKAALTTIALYRQIQGARLNLHVMRATRERRQLQLEKVKSLLESGFVRPVDTLAVRLSVLDAGQQILSEQSRLFRLQQKLNNLFGRQVNVEDFKESSALQSPELNLGGVEQLQTLELNGKLIDFQTRQKRSSFYPRVALVAAYNYGNPGVDIINSNWMDYYTLGINLSWSLWEGRRHSHDVRAMDYSRRQLELQKNNLTRRWRSDFLETREEIKVLRKALRLAGKRVELARRKWRILSAQLEEGTAQSKEVDDASLQLTQAELALNAQKIALRGKQNELEYLSGKPISEWSVQ